MRSGASTEDLATGIALGVRVDVYRGSRVLAADIPASEVTLEIQSSRLVTERLTYQLPDDWVPTLESDPANSFGQRSFVTVIQKTRSRTYETPLGFFTHGSKTTPGWEETDKAVKVTAFGLLQIAADNPFAWPSSPEPSASFLSELSRLSGLPVVLENFADFLLPRTLQWGTDRLDSITDLCASHGVKAMVRADGYVHAFRPVDHAPDASYTHQGGLLGAPRKGLPRRANTVIVVGSSDTTDTAEKFTETRVATTSPYSPESYGLVAERIELSGAVTRGQVAAAAQDALRDLITTRQVRSLETILDPRLEIGDIINVITDKGEHLIGRITALAATWKPGNQMRIDVEVYE